MKLIYLELLSCRKFVHYWKDILKNVLFTYLRKRMHNIYQIPLSYYKKKTNVWIVFHTNFNIGIFLVVQFNLFTLLYVVKIRRWCCHGKNDVKHFCINLHYVKQPSKTLLLFYTTHQLHQWHLIIRFSWFIWVVTGRKHKKRIKRISLRSSLIYL